MQFDGLAPRIAPEQPRRAAIGAEQAEQNPDCGGFPGPVRPEEAVHLAGRDRQVEAIERESLAEGFAQPGDFDSVHGKKEYSNFRNY